MLYNILSLHTQALIAAVRKILNEGDSNQVIETFYDW